MARISSKHQITLPVAAMDAVGLRAGDTVEVRVEGSALVIESYRDVVASNAGVLTGRIDRTVLTEIDLEWE